MTVLSIMRNQILKIFLSFFMSLVMVRMVRLDE